MSIPGLDMPVVYRDEHLLVVDKPADLLSVPGIGPGKTDCVANRVRRALPEAEGPLICHRLDMATSGIIALGLTPDAHRSLSVQFQDRKASKTYTALADGRLDPALGDTGEIDLPIRKDLANRPKQIADPAAGRPSRTRWRLLGVEDFNGRPVSRLELIPITGRRHQLRVHLASPLGLGVPVLGDAFYGDEHAAPRMMLHATTLTIHHPATGEMLELRADPPF